MNTKIDKNGNEKKIVVYLFLASLLFGLAASFLGHIIGAVASGFLAALWYFEQKEKRVLSYISPIVMLIADVIINGFTSFVSVFSIFLALMIFFSYKLKLPKCESEFAMTLVSSSFILIALFALGSQNEEGLSAIDYYLNMADEYKQYFIETFNDIYSTSGIVGNDYLTDEQLASIFDSAMDMVVSMLIIYGFMLSGIACKIFSFTVSKNEKNDSEIKKWRFFTPSSYAYFYVLLMFISIFLGSAEGNFAITVLNLKNVFMIVYAYMGFSFLHKLLSTKMKPIIAFILILSITLLFSSFFVSALSLFGVFYTFTINRYKNGSSFTDDDPQV